MLRPAGRSPMHSASSTLEFGMNIYNRVRATLARNERNAKREEQRASDRADRAQRKAGRVTARAALKALTDLNNSPLALSMSTAAGTANALEDSMDALGPKAYERAEVALEQFRCEQEVYSDILESC